MVVTAYSIYLTFEATAFRTLGETTERMGIRFVLLPIEKILFPRKYRVACPKCHLLTTL